MQFARDWLPNVVRRTIRSGIERLPDAAQRYFPAPDIRRRIRENPLERDAIDPDWRVATPEEILQRQRYITLEGNFVTAGLNEPITEEYRRRYLIPHMALAAMLYDSHIEGMNASRAIYKNVSSRSLGDRSLIDAMTRRADAAFAGVDLSPINPLLLPFPHGLRRYYSTLASKRRLDRTANEAPPYGLSNELFDYIGVTLPAPKEVENALPNFGAQHAARDQHEQMQQNIARAAAVGLIEPAPGFVAPAAAPAAPAAPAAALLDYNSLPNNGNVTVSGADPIDYEEFKNNEDVMLITGADGHRFVYKRASLLPWIHGRQSEGLVLTNPGTGLQMTVENITRGKAVVSAGGRRRSRQTRRRRQGKRRGRTSGRR